MRIQTYQLSVAAGVFFAVWLAFVRSKGPEDPSAGLIPLLEAGSVALTVSGTLMEQPRLRKRFDALGGRKGSAKDPTYLRDRLRFQRTAVVATATFWSLIAGRNGIETWTALPLLVGLLVLLPILNRAAGRRSE